jgi:lysyl-tRNA synthetase class 2
MTLGGLFDGSQPQCLVFVAYDDAAMPVAFQRYVPCGHGRALSLDITRRLHGGPNGINEFVIVQAVRWAAEHEVREVSLNFAAFRALLEENAALESFQSVEAWFVRRLEGHFGIQMDTLRRFNAKFHPRWVPRHLVFRRPGDLPAVGVAALSAEAFLPFDRHREPAPTY